jgi:hypothetical protein
MTVIRKDGKGLYAVIDSYICRPQRFEHFVTDGRGFIRTSGTQLKEGDDWRSTHPAGPQAYLRNGKKGTPSYRLEIWDIIETLEEYKNPELYNRFEPWFMEKTIWDPRSSVGKSSRAQGLKLKYRIGEH